MRRRQALVLGLLAALFFAAASLGQATQAGPAYVEPGTEANNPQLVDKIRSADTMYSSSWV